MRSFHEHHVKQGNQLLSDTGGRYTIQEVRGSVVVAVRTFVLTPNDSFPYWYRKGNRGTLHPIELSDISVGTIVVRGNEDGAGGPLKGEFVVTSVSARHKLVVITQTLIIDDPAPWSVIIRQ